MVEITVRSDARLEKPVPVEGLPGVGLVGKIATDHLVEELEMEPYADIEGEPLPAAAVFEGGDRTVSPPFRLFAEPDADLLALVAATPLPGGAVGEFTAALTDWLAEREVTAVYASDFPGDGGLEPESRPDLYGIGTGRGVELLADADVDPSTTGGTVSGPVGALLDRARGRLDAAAIVVETDPRFPDPQGGRLLIEEAIAPIAGIDVDTDRLIDEAERIMEGREELARRIQQADHGETTQTRGMYH